MEILFVCDWNASRSQAAESILKSLSRGQHVASSAGFKVNENEGQKLKDNPGAHFMLESLKEIGIDMSEQIRQQVSPDMLENAEKIIAFSAKDSVPASFIQNPKVEFWDVAFSNPSLEGARQVRDQIRKSVQELLERI